MKRINDRIKAVAEHYNIKSYAEFGKRVGISTKNASNYLKGRREPDLDNLSKIQKTFREIDADWLLTGRGSMLRDRSDQGLCGIPDYKEGEKEIISKISPGSVLRYVTREGAHRFKGNKVVEYYIESLVYDEMHRINVQRCKDALSKLESKIKDKE